MSNYTSLLEAFNTVNLDQPPAQVEYKLYYNVTGMPTLMSSDTGTEGDFIIIDRATYEKGITPSMRVIDNELVYIEQVNFKKNLEKSTHGYPVVKNHPALLIEPTEYFNQIEYYAKPR